MKVVVNTCLALAAFSQTTSAYTSMVPLRGVTGWAKLSSSRLNVLIGDDDEELEAAINRQVSSY